MFKKALSLGIVSGLLSGIVAIAYAKLYFKINEADFSKVAPNVKIIAASLLGGVLAAIGYTLLDRWMKEKGEIVFNFVFTILSLATLLAPIAVRLPVGSVDTPELFPGLAIPMHLFPALAWYTLKPLFIRK